MSPIFFFIASFVFGAIIGSFLNVVIWRLPRGQSLGGRSQCPHCGNVLTAVQLIPVFSYLWQRGRCRNCRQAISPWYLIIELVTAVLFALAGYFIHPMTAGEYIMFARMLLFLAVMVLVFVIDFEHFLILDLIVLPAAAVVLILNIAADLATRQSLLYIHGATVGGLLAAAAFGLFFFLLCALSKGRWMGFGDVKLAVLLGLFLGLPLALVGFILAFWLGAILGIILMVGKKKTMESRLPFGTFLAVASVIAAFYGHALWGAYLKLVF